jgi:hypothetical protein
MMRRPVICGISSMPVVNMLAVAINPITHVETVALCRGIARHTITRTHVEGADPPKTPTAVNYGLKTNHAKSCLRQEHSARYFPCR